MAWTNWKVIASFPLGRDGVVRIFSAKGDGSTVDIDLKPLRLRRIYGGRVAKDTQNGDYAVWVNATGTAAKLGGGTPADGEGLIGFLVGVSD